VHGDAGQLAVGELDDEAVARSKTISREKAASRRKS